MSLKWLNCQCWRGSSDAHENLEGSNKQKKGNISQFELMELPNECLYEIFDRLDILSLCQLAGVSNRVRTIAERVFFKRHHELDYKDVGYKRPLLRRVLCKFGHLITAIDDGYCILRVKEQIDMYAISVYCTELEELSLRGMLIDCDEMKPLLSRLTALKLVWCEFRGNKNNLLKKCNKLKALYIYHAKHSSFIAQTFPKMVDLQFDTSWGENYTIVKLISLNPQLRRLLIPVEMNDFFISIVVEHASNLEKLHFIPGVMTTVDVPTHTEHGLMQLSKLKKLKHLVLNTGNETYLKNFSSLMSALSEAKAPLEVVYLRSFSINSEDMRCFKGLKSITMIDMHEMANCSGDDLLNLVHDLPSLNILMLRFDNNKRNQISVDDLVSIVKAGRELQVIHLRGVRNFRINQSVYEKLAEAVKSQWVFREMKLLHIQICACKCTTNLDIPMYIRQEYSKKFWFSVDVTEPVWNCKDCA